MVMVTSFSFITHLARHAEIDGDATRTKKKQKAILLTMTHMQNEMGMVNGDEEQGEGYTAHHDMVA